MVFRWFKRDKSKEYQRVEPKSDRVDRKTSSFEITPNGEYVVVRVVEMR